MLGIIFSILLSLSLIFISCEKQEKVEEVISKESVSDTSVVDTTEFDEDDDWE